MPPLGRILEQAPGDGAVTPPDAAQGLRLGEEYCGILGSNAVLDSNEDRPTVRLDFAMRFGGGPRH